MSSGVAGAARSAGSLSRASLSMVLCEDFGTALCDADDADEAAFPLPPDAVACSGAPDISKSDDVNVDVDAKFGDADGGVNSRGANTRASSGAAADGAKSGTPAVESAAKRRRSAEVFPLAHGKLTPHVHFL